MEAITLRDGFTHPYGIRRDSMAPERPGELARGLPLERLGRKTGNEVGYLQLDFLTACLFSSIVEVIFV